MLDKKTTPAVDTHSEAQGIILGEKALTVDDVVRVTRYKSSVQLTDDPVVLERMAASYRYIQKAVQNQEPIYGVTTGFGGMAHTVISSELAAELQDNLIWYHKTGAGRRLNSADVRAAMLLRANSHLWGASGLRQELVERLITFINAEMTPQVYEFGSIGASGDLVPLTYITGAITGTDHSFTVEYQGREMSSLAALEHLRLKPLPLQAKEGLAMINGTSMMTGIAALCVYDAQVLLSLSIGAQALIFQALQGTNQSFHPFIHQLKPHVGQRWIAAEMLRLMQSSAMIRDELDGSHNYRGTELIQDRYSLRCLPQFFGPIIEGLAYITRCVETEMNSVSDNPLIDVEAQMSLHGGNFLGQYIGIAMDQLRSYVGLLAKHLDAQIALLVTPEFSNGLPACLIGNLDRKVNMGLKGLQLTANSIMPLLTFFGNTFVDRFPTHAEQYNQNINSQGFGAANLARQSIDAFTQYIAIALMFGVQGADLRTYERAGHYDARELLAPASVALYTAVRTVVGRPPDREEPYIRNDNDQPLDLHIMRIAADISAGGTIVQAMNATREAFKQTFVQA